MPRANWKGLISFGLVSIPIMLIPLDKKSARISFHQIDKRDNSRIKYQRINENTGKVVPWEQITRGYEYDEDTVIPVPENVIEKVSNSHSVDIENFIDLKKIDLFMIQNSYYILPDKKAMKGYVILREALKDSHKVGIAKVIISTKEYLCAVIPYEDALILCLLKYDSEVKKLDELDLPDQPLASYKITKTEIDIAKKLISSMSKPWKPEKYVDDYQKTIHEWAEDAINHLPHKTVSKKRQKAAGNNIDFVALLRKSISAKPKSAKPKKKTKKPVLRHVQKQSRHATKH